MVYMDHPELSYVILVGETLIRLYGSVRLCHKRQRGHAEQKQQVKKRAHKNFQSLLSLDESAERRVTKIVDLTRRAPSTFLLYTRILSRLTFLAPFLALRAHRESGGEPHLS
jgi:hypothetical protein